MAIFTARRRKKIRDACDDCASSSVPDCGNACGPDCGPDCGDCVPDCNPCMIAPFLLGLVATRAPKRRPRERTGVPGRAGIAAIRGYQRWISPRLNTRCRHRPTCSAFGVTAVARYGLITGSRLTADRIRRCNASVPRGTSDPVP